jgi:hypothetical protein
MNQKYKSNLHLAVKILRRARALSFIIFEPGVGIEPTTPFLPRKCSTTELSRQFFMGGAGFAPAKANCRLVYSQTPLSTREPTHFVGGVGIEPTTSPLSGVRSTTELATRHFFYITFSLIFANC